MDTALYVLWEPVGDEELSGGRQNTDHGQPEASQKDSCHAPAQESLVRTGHYGEHDAQKQSSRGKRLEADGTVDVVTVTAADLVTDILQLKTEFRVQQPSSTSLLPPLERPAPPAG